MKSLFDWSKPRTWMLFGLLVAVLGSVLMSAEGAEDGGGRLVVVAGVGLFLIGLVAYLVVQVLKAIEAGKGD